MIGLTACAGAIAGADLPPPHVPPPGADYLPADKGWALIWQDEFDGDQLDPTRWEIEESCWGGGNQERQCYTSRARNVEVLNGQLRLKAFRERVSGWEFPQGWADGRGRRLTQDYSSGKVRTRARADWTYGRFAARIKLPKGQGTWPAFWMLPSDNVYGGWAASGEIDIMEAVNLGEPCDACVGEDGENRTSGALHFGGEWPDNTYHVQHTELPNGADKYHVFAVEWGEGRINWFVDDIHYFSLAAEDWYSETTGIDSDAPAPFDQPFYLMLNYAVGGKLSETNNRGGFDPSSYPSELLVDWVRVYSCARESQRGLACMQPPMLASR